MTARLGTSRETDAFTIRDLFFSRTDQRGIIQSGNEDFRRISGYDWDSLLGAPHKIVRHPGMPKGLFHLLWQAISTGRPLGAYMVNRAADGLAYSVFAVIMPIPEGLLSVRLKPTTARVEEVKAIYDAVSTAEREDNLNPADSAGMLVE